MPSNKQTFKQFLMLFTTGLTSYFIINTANAYLARTLGRAAYGDFSLVISLIFSLTPFFAIGITFLITKYLPVYMSNNSNHKKNMFLRWNIKTLQKSLLILLLIVIISTILLVTQFNRDLPCIVRQCQNYRPFIEELFYIIPFALLLIWNTSLLNATKHPMLSQTLGGNNLTCICALMIFTVDILIDSLFFYHILVAIFMGIFALWLLQCLSIYFVLLKPKTLSIRDIRNQHIPRHISKFYTKSGVSLMFNNIIYIAIGLINMLMIEWLSPDEKVLGRYVIVMKISLISGVLPNAISFLITPHLSELKKTNRIQSLQRIINLQVIAGLIWTLICLIMVLVFKDAIFRAYSINFENATFSICLLIIITYVFNIVGMSERICLFNDMNKFLYPISVLQCASIGLLAYFLIPQYSYLGAIYALGISEVLCASICWILVRTHGIKIKIFGFI